MPDAVCSAPDTVELILVFGQHPALSDSAVAEAVYPVCSPLRRVSIAGHSPSRDDESVVIVRQHVVHGDLEGARGELPSLSDVLHYMVESSVFTCDRVPAGDVPHDIVGEDIGKLAVVSRRPGFVFSAKKRLVRMRYEKAPKPAEINSCRSLGGTEAARSMRVTEP
jgi:hypothetical protein